MKVVLVTLMMVLGFESVVFARHFSGPDQFFRHKKNQEKNHDQNSSNKIGNTSDDNDLVRAVRDRRQIYFIQAGKLTVTKILPDDTSGLEHQRWYVRLSDGSVVFAVYNIDMSDIDRVPVAQGQNMALGGQFKWTNNGGLMHWLHYDPRGSRPDGFVEVNGQRYGIKK